MTIYETVIGVLRHYRQYEVADENGDGYPLIDALTLEGHGIDMGIREIENIADAIASALRREPVEPQRCAECDCESGGPDCNWIKWDPQPDALALVAAAYRDAADKALNGNIEEQGHQGLALEIACSTPADATAALAAIERAAYERGVRDAAKACDWGDIYGENAVCAILALLTQEGR